MSDSDSESDFESADEDAEHDFSSSSSDRNKTKENTESQINDLCQSLSSQIKPENTVSSHENVTFNDSRTKSSRSEPMGISNILQESNEKKTERILNRTLSEPQKDENSETKRVTLRLEKKLKQKGQTHSSDRNSYSQNQEKTSSWGFSSWGTSLLSSAASSVSTFTSQVSQGIGTVLETVETTLGAPPAETLAEALSKRKNSKESNDSSGDKPDEESKLLNENAESPESETSSTLGVNLLTGVSTLTKAIENTGAKVIMGGLDTLELIGKKTIDIITEGDPGLRKKRSAFSPGITLSQILREAKEKAEEANDTLDDQENAIHYSRCFDDSQGLVHLEALEMLSSQNQTKVQGSLLMLPVDSDKKTKLDQVKNICENLPSADDTPDDETEQNFEEVFSEHMKALHLQIGVEKIMEVHKSINVWIDECQAEQSKGERKDPKEIYHQAIRSLAEFTAKSVEQFHKVAELILVQSNTTSDAVEYAIHLTGLTTVLCIEIGIMASKFCHCLSTAADDSEDPDSATPLITSVYLEASNSTTYMQDAFQLLVPILQASLLIQE